MVIEVILITGRTVNQGITLDEKCEEDYVKESAICELSREDMKEAGIKDGDVVRVCTEEGEVHVFAKASEQVEKGIAFMPMSVWANMVIPEGTDSMGMPTFKGIRARIELARDAKVLRSIELVRRLENESK